MLAVSCEASGVVPGDEDPFCRNLTTENILGSNSRILLDSFNYRNLLSPHAGAVWQMVNNNSTGQGEVSVIIIIMIIMLIILQWFQNGSNPCRQSIGVCGSFEECNRNNWIITQYINRTIDGNHLSHYLLQLEIDIQDCSPFCERSFGLSRYDTSNVDNTVARNTSNYPYPVVLIANYTGDSQRGIITLEQSFDTDEEGFYLAFTDGPTCILITRVIVYYNICPQETEEFTIRPETIAPRIDLLTITAECVEGATPENGVAPRLTCSQGGEWNTVPNEGCHCNTGFIAAENGRSCTGI